MASNQPNQGAWQGDGASDKPHQGAWQGRSDAAAGWAHKFNGVANASISKINGVAKASISKVNGVS